jgi:glutathione synthase/RimK-type ligase-like ATP-grasp enzyme
VSSNRPVLIITSKEDVHADFVILKIREKGADVVRINTEDLQENSSFALEFNRGNWVDRFALLDSSVQFDSSQISAVWYRKPQPVEVSSSIVELHAREFVRDEFDFFLRSYYLLLQHKKWVNPYWSIRHAGQKLPNLLLASKLGFKTPKTLVTNRVEDAREFGRENRWEIIVKPFFFSGFVIAETQPWHCFTNDVSEREFDRFADSIGLAPTMLQQNIRKKIELRITVIGSQVFCAAIDSQGLKRTATDWRAFDSYKVPHSVYELPAEVTARLLNFNEHFGLAFSTFDLIVTPEGEYVFLECNPNGQWYWIEDLIQLPMSAAMADLLLN